MFLGGFKLFKNYAFDYCFFYKIRNFSDGISFINADINLDLYENDHNPSFNMFLCIFNMTIFDLSIYNVNHISHKDDKNDFYDEYDEYNFYAD